MRWRRIVEAQGGDGLTSLVHHALTVLSRDAKYTVVLSEDMQTEHTPTYVWPSNVIHSPLAVHHALTILSPEDAEYKVVLSGDTHTEYTLLA